MPNKKLQNGNVQGKVKSTQFLNQTQGKWCKFLLLKFEVLFLLLTQHFETTCVCFLIPVFLAYQMPNEAFLKLPFAAAQLPGSVKFRYFAQKFWRTAGTEGWSRIVESDDGISQLFIGVPTKD